MQMRIFPISLALVWSLVCTACKNPSDTPASPNAQPVTTSAAATDTPSSAGETPAGRDTTAPEKTPGIEKTPSPDAKFATRGKLALLTAIDEANTLAKSGDYNAAFDAITRAEIEFGQEPRLITAFEKLYDEAPSYNALPRRMRNNTDVTAIKHLGGGSSLVYRVIKDQQTYAAFKPKQTRKQSNPDAEIAAYRLCPLIRCRFNIPKNEPVYFEYVQFSGLYARIPGNPPGEFKELVLKRMDDGSDAVTGTLKDWIPDYVRFPIEVEELWKPWFSLSREELQNTRAFEALESFASKESGSYSAKLKNHLADATAYEVALQISNLLVFDFLINNWDRFSKKKEYFGVNCQFANKRFMSIDNGATFSQTASNIPKMHFMELTRFSRLTYFAILNLSHDTTLHRLFPQATQNDLHRFETFWRQRQSYLNRVQELISKNGEENTLFFE